MRQVIFGNLNPKRQQTVQKYIMSLLTNKFIELGLNKDDILNCTSDELIFEFKPQYQDVVKLLNNKELFPEIDFHVEQFVLHKLTEDKPFYYKKDINNKVTLKGIPAHSVLESIKFIEDKKIEPVDLQFVFEGRLCQFTNSVFK